MMMMWMLSMLMLMWMWMPQPKPCYTKEERRVAGLHCAEPPVLTLGEDVGY
jgi:hypothetical protein